MNFPSNSLLRSAPVCAALALTWLMPSAANAQDRSVITVAPPQPVAPVAPSTTTTTTPVTKVAPTGEPSDKILLNFQGAALKDVLNYLSEAAGFLIIGEPPSSGTVDIISRQPITGEEAVDLLNAVLIEKGYVAIRNGRILKIVSKTDAPRHDIPVKMGSDPDEIPRKDEMVTQVLPLRFGEAGKLIENLRPLLPDGAAISANDGSNAILMTDTQTNIRRIAQIIRALDTSVSSISAINIFPMQFADAKEVATVITQLFTGQQAVGAPAQGGRGGRGGFGGFGGFGGRGGDRGGAPQSAAQSEARLAATRVVAVADEQSNSVIVSAPEENMPMIRELITQIDTSVTDVTETRIFRLIHADATELAEIVNNVYSEVGQTQNGQRGQGRGGDRGGGRDRGQQQPQQSGRALLQSRVVAVGDPRTNSVVVTAAQATMVDISEMVGRLDATDAKKQRVYVYSLEHADANTVADVLRGMMGEAPVGGRVQDRLLERTTTGASIDSDLGNGGGGGLGGGGGGRAR